jgi:hypothetical protein
MTIVAGVSIEAPFPFLSRIPIPPVAGPIHYLRSVKMIGCASMYPPPGKSTSTIL